MRKATRYLDEALIRVRGYEGPRLKTWVNTIEEMLSDGDYTEAEAIMAATALHREANRLSVPVASCNDGGRKADSLRAKGYGIYTLGRQAIIS